jgi:hypothetical protein
VAKRYIQTIPNPGSNGPRVGTFYPDTELGRDHPDAVAFASKWDIPGQSVYDAVNLFRDDATERKIETAAEYERISSDIDLKDIEEPAEKVVEVLLALFYPPSEIRHSGHGIHADWNFKERLSAATEAAAIKAVRDRLCKLLCADPSINHDAALLRRLGTTNSKDPANPAVCRTIAATGHTYDLHDIDDLVDEHGGRPLFTRKEKPARNSNGGGEAHAADGAEHIPVDVEHELAAMSWKGRNGPDINSTYKRTSCRYLRDGFTPDEFEVKWIAAAMACSDREDLGWSRGLEVEDVRRRLASTMADMAKHSPNELPWLTPDQSEVWYRAIAAGRQPRMCRNGAGWHVRSYVPGEGPHTNGGEAPHTSGDEAPHTSGDEAPHADNSAAAGQKASSWPTPYQGRAPGQIPRRKFVMGQHMQRGKVTVTAGPSGIGKSNHGLLEAIGAAIGKDLITGEPLEQRYRVWVWNGEDDIDEQERRICGHCEWYNINREDLKGWLFIDDPKTCPLEFASAAAGGRITLHDSAIVRVADRVKELRLDVVSLDPLISIHTLPENDNVAANKIMRTLQNRIGEPSNAAIDVAHHTRKASKDSDGSLTADDVRGAGAIVSSSRSTRLFIPMSKAEAEEFGISPEDRLRFFRVEKGKANYAKRGPLYWIELVERPIPNGENGTYGDVITVCTRWVPPTATANVTNVIAAAIRDEIGKGEWRRDPRAQASWAGHLIGRRLGLDTGQAAIRSRVTKILSWLINTGVLATEFRKDKDSKTHEYVIPGTVPHPGGS